MRPFLYATNSLEHLTILNYGSSLSNCESATFDERSVVNSGVMNKAHYNLVGFTRYGRAKIVNNTDSQVVF